MISGDGSRGGFLLGELFCLEGEAAVDGDFEVGEVSEAELGASEDSRSVGGASPVGGLDGGEEFLTPCGDFSEGVGGVSEVELDGDGDSELLCSSLSGVGG